jgi:hypothetical protein
MSHEPTWKVPGPSNDWMGDKITKQTDEELLRMAKAHSDRLSGKEPEQSPPTSPGEDTPVDPVAEQTAFADLLKFIADNPEDDCEFTALSLDDFATETFTPPPSEPKEPTP